MTVNEQILQHDCKQSKASEFMLPPRFHHHTQNELAQWIAAAHEALPARPVDAKVFFCFVFFLRAGGRAWDESSNPKI